MTNGAQRPKRSIHIKVLAAVFAVIISPILLCGACYNMIYVPYFGPPLQIESVGELDVQRGWRFFFLDGVVVNQKSFDAQLRTRQDGLLHARLLLERGFFADGSLSLGILSFIERREIDPEYAFPETFWLHQDNKGYYIFTIHDENDSLEFQIRVDALGRTRHDHSLLLIAKMDSGEWFFFRYDRDWTFGTMVDEGYSLIELVEYVEDRTGLRLNDRIWELILEAPPREVP